MTLDAADDESVASAGRLFRRITEHHFAPAPEQPGGLRISSAAFQPASDGSGISISISIEDRMIELGIQPSDLVADYEDVLLAFITAGVAREHGKRVVRDPVDEDLAHGNLIGRDTGGVRKRLARAAQWEIGPGGF